MTAEVKKIPLFIITILIALISNNLIAQQQITWLGVDFSEVKLLGDFSDKTPGEVRDQCFPVWNSLTATIEYSKVVTSTVKRKDIKYNLEMTNKLNRNVSELNLITSNNFLEFDSEYLEKIISKYDYQDVKGIGILLIAESLNKTNEVATFHFVMIDIETNRLLSYSRHRSNATGIGLINHWDGTIYNVIAKAKYSKHWKVLQD